MFFKIDWKLYEKICNITKTDYEAIGEFLTYDSIVGIIEDLLLEIEAKNEQLEDIKRDIKENYVVKTNNWYDEYGVSERDFL